MLPAGDGWLYEPKLDGFRALIHFDGRRIHIDSRNGKTTVEDLLERGGWSSSVEVEAVAAVEIHATDDLHASAEYRRHAAASLVGTAVQQARSRR